MPLLNRWFVADEPIVRWRAAVGRLFQTPDQVVLWLRQLLEAAEAEKVCTVYATDTYQRTKDGPFPAFVQAEYERTGVVDLNVFRWRLTDQIGGQLGYYDTQGQVQETEVFDLGVLWRQCYPDDQERQSWGHHQPVLSLIGPTLATHDPVEMARIRHYVNPDLGLTIAIYSDIWLPWIDGVMDETHDVDKVYDNRVLARRHTPRLNRFLATAQAATVAIGGRWYLNRDPDALRRDRAFMVHDTGIDLEATLPEGVTENDGTGIPSYRKTELDGKAILAAVRQAKAHPDMPRTPVVVYRTPTPRLQQLLADQGIPWHIHEED